MKCENQRLQNVNECYFAMYEAALFLDTHPGDEDALEWFFRMREAYEKAREEYVQKDGPLRLCDVCSEQGRWSWIDDPWPWEGRCC